jgi:predicted dehydrogenase
MDRTAKPLTFALVGCGAIADTHAKALVALAPHARLAACCDVEAARAAALAGRFGCRAAVWAEVLADPAVDAVSICTPSGLHAALAIEAFRAGKHVIVEKPMDITPAACDAMLAAQRASGRQLAVVSQHRFDPASAFARRVVESGELGRLVLVEMRVPWYRTQEYYDSGDWRGTWDLDGGGALMNQGVHTADLMLWLAGPVRRIQAASRTAAHERIEVEDVVCAVLEFENGSVGTLLATTAAYPGFPVSLSLHGTEGSLILEGDELKLLAVRGRETLSGAGATAHALQVAAGGTRAAVRESGAQSLAAGGWVWGDAHRAQLLDFCEAIRTGGTPLSDGCAGRAAVALIRAVYDAAAASRGQGG